MTKMTNEIKITAIFVCLVVFQIGWHWFLTWHNSVSQAALRMYILHSAHSRKGVAGYVDIALPSVLIGLLLGRIGWQWTSWKLASFLLVFGAVLVALTPVYAGMLTAAQAWWWPKGQSDLSLFLIGQATMTLLLLAVSVYGGRLWRLER